MKKPSMKMTCASCGATTTKRPALGWLIAFLFDVKEGEAEPPKQYDTCPKCAPNVKAAVGVVQP